MKTALQMDNQRLREQVAALEQRLSITERELFAYRQEHVEERIEQQLLELEHLYRTAPVGLLLVDTELRYVRINERMAVLNGAPVEAHLGRTLSEVVPDIAPSVIPHYRSVIATGEPIVNVQIRGKTRATSDQEHFYKVSYYPFKNAGGVLVGVTAIVQDVTEQRQAEEALSVRKREFETLVENSPDVIARYAPGLHCLYINQALKRVSGLMPEQVIGRALDEAGFPEEVAIWHPPVAAAFATGEEQTVEFPFPGPNGLHFYHSRIVPERGATGTIESVLAITQDITERKKAEEALRHTNENLRRANAELEQFAYIASHDLREPLRMVKVYTQLLLRRYINTDDEEAREFANFISQGVSRMEQLIGDALSYSRAVHDETPAHPVQLEGALSSFLVSLSEEVSAASAVITSDPLLHVMADDLQLQHVFSNLLTNALRFRSSTHTPRIHVSAYRENGECIVSVSDNGIGFQRQYSERIFGLFKRLHKDEYPGTGLGLALCRRIIERFGGRIWAESTGVGNGATFFFALPSAEATDNTNRRSEINVGNRTALDAFAKASLYSLLIHRLRSRAIFLTDEEGRIRSWHQGVEQLLGYGESEWVGQSASTIFTAEDLGKKEFEKEMKQAVRDGEAADVRWHKRKDGSLVFIDGVLVCLRDEAGAVIGFSKVMRDATDAKLAEEAVRRSEERLRFAQEVLNSGYGIGTSRQMLSRVLIFTTASLDWSPAQAAKTIRSGL